MYQKLETSEIYYCILSYFQAGDSSGIDWGSPDDVSEVPIEIEVVDSSEPIQNNDENQTQNKDGKIFTNNVFCFV